MIKDITVNLNGGLSNRVAAQLPTKQPSLNLNLNSPPNIPQSPSLTYRSFPGNKLSAKSFTAYKNLMSTMSKKSTEYPTKTKLMPTANSSFVQTWSSSSVNNIAESLIDSTQINYGPTISTANSNGSLSNYVINSVTNNSNVNKVTFSNGLVSSNSNGNTYRGSGGSLFAKSTTLNINGHQNDNLAASINTNHHLTLPNHINNLTVQSNKSHNNPNQNENASFTQLIDPLKEVNSNKTETLNTNSKEDHKKSNEDLM